MVADVRPVDPAQQLNFPPISIQRSKWTHQFQGTSPNRGIGRFRDGCSLRSC